ncbi:unnamed protein product [Meloidogyne enterolobii]|uniref:Uncharacterized protein n=1 Tax=Meloidogyne enterolobii TaxID=390850 RepID=A0ACB1B0F3_MELEN
MRCYLSSWLMCRRFWSRLVWVSWRLCSRFWSTGSGPVGYRCRGGCDDGASGTDGGLCDATCPPGCCVEGSGPDWYGFRGGFVDASGSDWHECFGFLVVCSF